MKLIIYLMSFFIIAHLAAMEPKSEESEPMELESNNEFYELNMYRPPVPDDFQEYLKTIPIDTTGTFFHAVRYIALKKPCTNKPKILPPIKPIIVEIPVSFAPKKPEPKLALLPSDQKTNNYMTLIDCLVQNCPKKVTIANRFLHIQEHKSPYICARCGKQYKQQRIPFITHLQKHEAKEK